MKKKAYLIPCISVIIEEPQYLLFTGSDPDTGITINEEEDNDEGPNRSRRRNTWDDEEEEW